jgi:hypothetical protein
MAYPSVVLLSDFGNAGAAALAGICKSVNPGLSVYELSHDVPKFDIRAAASILSDQLSAWPRGTVFVCAVDPHFTVDQRVLGCLTSDGYIAVGADNGCLSEVIRRHGVTELRELTTLNQRYLSAKPAAVQHGRNLVFCAASIAAANPPFNQSGELCDVPEDSFSKA